VAIPLSVLLTFNRTLAGNQARDIFSPIVLFVVQTPQRNFVERSQ